MKHKLLRIGTRSSTIAILAALFVVGVALAAWLFLSQTWIRGGTAPGTTAVWSSPACTITVGPGVVHECGLDQTLGGAPGVILSALAPGTVLTVQGDITNTSAQPIRLQPCNAAPSPHVTATCSNEGVPIAPGATISIVQVYTFGPTLPSDSSIDFLQDLVFGL